ncbi:FliM/FliN family flagellar motor switch protein [Rhodovulum sp. YEN HP10]|uniref:FliM/FliN family flagellar motor switch protein n=1 Tax=Rhodovulum sp. HP10 TaxID=3387397 RepID=UPI0039E00BDF
MAENGHHAILRRILGEDRVSLGGARGGGNNGAAALRLEMARATRDAFGLTALVEECKAEKAGLPEIEAEIGPGALPILLRTSDGRLGLVVYSSELALALLEWRLIGFLSETAPPERTLTATDAAVLADLTDPVLERFGRAMKEADGVDWASGYTQGARIEDPRHVPLIMASGRYRLYRLRLVAGRGRAGGLIIALPEAAPVVRPRTAGNVARPWPEALRAGVLGAELSLNAVLWRSRVSAAAIARFRPGDLIPLPAAALRAVQLEGPGGVVIAGGRLGQAHGDRAIKLDSEGGGTEVPGFEAPQLGSALPMGEPGFGLDDEGGLDFAAEGLPADGLDLGGEEFPFDPAGLDSDLENALENGLDGDGFGAAPLDLSEDFPSVSA